VKTPQAEPPMRIDSVAAATDLKFVLDSAATIHELPKRGTRHTLMVCPIDKE
jgi:hypothetical protein